MGGAVGSVLRYFVTIFLARVGTGYFPLGTFTANVTGSLLLGFFSGYFAPSMSSPVTLALTVGLCGGYTTFSTFTLELFRLAERGEAGRGILYAVASVVISFGALAVGHLAARMFRPVP